MAYYFMAGVYDVDLFTKDMSPILVNGKTLVDSGMTISTSNEEIRAGKGAQLYGRYFHTSGLTFTINDAMFNMDFIALNVGALKEIGGNTFAEEQVTIQEANTITVQGTPVDFLGKGLVGYYAPAGTNDYTKITFNGQSATATGVTVGEVYCVKYVIQNSNLEEITIPASIIPEECIMVLRGDLFLGSDPTNTATATKAGYVETIVPRFQPDGNVDFTVNMTGAAQTPLSGSALVAYDNTLTCGASGYYAKINKVVEDANWYDSLIALAVDDANIEFTAEGQTQTVVTYGVFQGLTASAVIPPANLTYTLSDQTNFKMDTTVPNMVKVAASASSGTKATLTVTVKGSGLPTKIQEIQAIANLDYTTE